MDGCGNKEGTKDFVEAQLSLVEYSVLSVCTEEQEAKFRQNLVWEEEGEGESSELTNANVVASNLLSSHPSGSGIFVVNRRDVSLVSFVTQEEVHEETPEERAERESKAENISANRWRRRQAAEDRNAAEEHPASGLDSGEEVVEEQTLEGMDVDSFDCAPPNLL